MNMTFEVTEFDGSVLKNSIISCVDKNKLKNYLIGSENAIVYQKKHGNGCQVKFFEDAVKFISKRL